MVDLMAYLGDSKITNYQTKLPFISIEPGTSATWGIFNMTFIGVPKLIFD